MQRNSDYLGIVALLHKGEQKNCTFSILLIDAAVQDKDEFVFIKKTKDSYAVFDAMTE